MKTKKLKKRSFVGAIALLVISAITLTTSTFAWFSMGEEAKIETMELTVSSSDGFEISANGNDDGWTSTLTPAEIFNLEEGDRNFTTKDSYMVANVETNYLPAELIPVSCAFENNRADFYKAMFAIGATEGPIDQTLSAKATAEGETTLTNQDKIGFVAFDLYIKSGFADAQNLYFNQSEFKYNENNEKGVEDKNSIEALRVGFAKYASDGNSFDNAVVFEPKTSGETTSYVNAAATGLAKTGKTFSTSNSNIVTSQTRIVTDQDAADQQYITVDNGVNKFRVFIWIEGNDMNCIDEIGSDELSATFRFLTKADATPQIP